MDKTFVNPNNSRGDEQKKVMDAIQESGVCPFCKENLRTYHKAKILYTGKHWVLTYNQWPRENTILHLLAIYLDHVVRLSDIDPEAGTELLEILAMVETRFGIEGGAILLRFGNSDFSGASVNHLHVQIIVPNKEGSDPQPVRFKVG